MITQLPMSVNKHSWWKAIDSGRVFVIVGIGLYWDDTVPLAFTNVTMLELGLSDDIVVPVETFLLEVDAGKIIPHKVQPYK